MDKCELQNSEMFQKTTSAQGVYLLQTSEMLKNEIKNHQKIKVIHE